MLSIEKYRITYGLLYLCWYHYYLPVAIGNVKPCCVDQQNAKRSQTYILSEVSLCSPETAWPFHHLDLDLSGLGLIWQLIFVSRKYSMIKTLFRNWSHCIKLLANTPDMYIYIYVYMLYPSLTHAVKTISLNFSFIKKQMAELYYTADYTIIPHRLCLCHDF